jgi:hypothetical protein
VTPPTYTAMIKLWRLVTEVVLRNVDSLPAGREIFQRGAMTLLRDNTPVFVDHDHDRPIGSVRELSNFADIDGDWLCAHTTITDAPDWLRQGTAASICYATAQRCALGATQRILRGLVTEVSVLSPGVEPAEPRAKVVLLRHADRPAPTVAHEPALAHIDNTGLLMRPGIGRILGVR